MSKLEKETTPHAADSTSSAARTTAVEAQANQSDMRRSVNGVGTARPALIVMDFQSASVENAGPEAPKALSHAAEAIGKARAAGLPILYGAVRLRPGHADVSDRNAMFVRVAESRAFDAGAASAEIHPDIAPQDGDITFVKRRVSSFAGSDLDVVLRSLHVERLVLAGLFTSGVVLSTLREAADRDFEAVVLADACADPDQGLHDVLVSRLFPTQATVLNVAAWDPGTPSAAG